MGLTGCPASFARMMDTIFQDHESIITYIDDLLLHSASWTEHLQHIETAFKLLIQHNLKLNLDKCTFGSRQVEYLGHTITAHGAIPGTDKTEALRNTASPTTPTEVRSFVGLANFFRQYINNFSALADPLFQVLKPTSGWKKGPLPEAAQKAFDEIKDRLTEKPVLAFPQSEGEFHLYTDASGGTDGKEGALGAALMQMQNGNKRMIAYASRKLRAHERNYPAGLLEKQAVVYSIEHFRHMLLGRKFIVFTDHRPLTTLSAVHKKTYSRLDSIHSEFTFEIRYVPGKDNTVADFLSRARQQLDRSNPYDGMGVAPLSTSSLHYGLHQARDKDCKTIRKALKQKGGREAILKEWRLQDISDRGGIIRVTPNPRKGFPKPTEQILVPPSLRQLIVKQAHDSALAGHGGTFKTMERIKQEFWWPKMIGDVTEHLARCEPCNIAGQKQPAPNTGTTPIPVPSEPNERVHADLFGPLKNKKGETRYILVVTDAMTKIVRLANIPDKSAETVASAMMDSWIAIFGVPRTILTDQGKEFCNKFTQAIWKALQVDHKTTTPYHPKTNSQVEVFNRTMGRYLRTMIQATSKDCGDWELMLTPLMIAHNTAVHKSTYQSPFHTMFGYDPKIPIWPEMEVLDKKIEEAAKEKKSADQAALEFQRRQAQARTLARSNAKEQQDRYRSAPPNEPLFDKNEKVWMMAQPPTGHNRKLKPRWVKAVIQAETHPNVFKVRKFTGRRRTTTVNAERLRHRHGEDEPEDEEDNQPRKDEDDNLDPDEIATVSKIKARMSRDLENWLGTLDQLTVDDFLKLFAPPREKNPAIEFMLWTKPPSRTAGCRTPESAPRPFRRAFSEPTRESRQSMQWDHNMGDDGNWEATPPYAWDPYQGNEDWFPDIESSSASDTKSPRRSAFKKMLKKFNWMKKTKERIDRLDESVARFTGGFRPRRHTPPQESPAQGDYTMKDEEPKSEDSGERAQTQDYSAQWDEFFTPTSEQQSTSFFKTETSDSSGKEKSNKKKARSKKKSRARRPQHTRGTHDDDGSPLLPGMPDNTRI